MVVEYAEGYPVQYKNGNLWMNFPLKLKWHTGIWFELFEKNTEFIVEDINRARAEDRLVIYLSCPVSGHAGAYTDTNIQIARNTAERLTATWGSRFWILNPVSYQLESREGTGLIKRHAKMLSLERGWKEGIDLEKLTKEMPVSGGDYLQMWAKVLVEDKNKNLGDRIDAFYFIGPTDVSEFFGKLGGRTITDGVEEYFARQYARDPQFRKKFDGTEEAERDFFKFYTLKAGANFSLGSHDEFNIWHNLNKLRRELLGIKFQIPGYFDGKQIGLGSAEIAISKGYAI